MKKMESSFSRFTIVRTMLALTVALTSGLLPGVAVGQQLLLSNPHWNITLSDFGYSDFMLDNTPGFEGREYLSGEWAAAVGYEVGGNPVPPVWFEPQFIFPDWPTHSSFGTASPLSSIGVNADGLPIAQSVITNGDLEITLRQEMLDTVIGTPMGISPASGPNPGAFINSDRYVLKQTCTIRNISGVSISNLNLFQFLHGLQSQRGVYDDRPWPGPLSEFRYDVTLAGVDAWAIGPGSSSAGLEDFISFHASVAPSAFEIGHYGIEGNGVDDHFSGKPSDGVHLSIENNWQTPPYAARQGTDAFTPAQRWVAGAQRWTLGNLAAGQSARLDVILSIITGTKVPVGSGSTGGCNGGSSVPGGVDYEFDDVIEDGSCFAEFSKAEPAEIEVRIAAGEFESLTFTTPGGPVQLWKTLFSGVHSGMIHLTMTYDPTVLPAGVSESALCLYQFDGTAWQKLTGVVNPVLNTISVTVTDLSVFVLGIESGVNFTVATTVSPQGSGSATGNGTYADGSGATLVAAANAGFVFVNWTENSTVVTASPTHTFVVQTNRAFVANFAAVTAGRSITTSSLPPNGGSTTGGGEYLPGALATVSAVPNPGYKFSKWQLNGQNVSATPNYTFTVADSQHLVAKFKPVYSVTVTLNLPQAGEVDGDTTYEAGELAVFEAFPDDGYCFVNWTQNGLPLSTSPLYTFSVTANRDLVANFAVGNRLTTVAEPVNAGTTSGGGIYDTGSNVTVIATANPGYVFLNWTEEGLPVSASHAYSFTCDATTTLVALFVAQPALQVVSPEPDVIELSWPAGPNVWALQENPVLSPAGWLDSTRPQTIVDGRHIVTVVSTNAVGFFRLRY